MYNALIEVKNFLDCTHLHLATPSNNAQHEEMIQILLAQGTNVNTIDWDGCTPLHYARNRSISKLLIEAGAEI